MKQMPMPPSNSDPNAYQITVSQSFTRKDCASDHANILTNI
ncbi:hypothetical protein [Legionella longbeachae]|nr:hypothetical protein [Legionella longbeachae]